MNISDVLQTLTMNEGNGGKMNEYLTVGQLSVSWKLIASQIKTEFSLKELCLAR